MTSPKNITTPQISQTVLAYYNAHYNNTTYRAFGDALADCLPGGHAHPDYTVIMNWLIDASFCRSGAQVYRNATTKLGVALMTYANSELFELAERHLALFNPAPAETLLIAGLLHSADVIRMQAESAIYVASDSHDWRGRVAFWWLNAIAGISQATYALLTGQHADYIQEKLSTAVRHVCNGLSEGAAAGFILNHPRLKWLVRFPLE